MNKYILLLIILLFPAAAFAAIHTETVEYQDGNTILEGFLAYDDAIKDKPFDSVVRQAHHSAQGKRPGVLVVHEWKGLNDYAKHRAEQLAQLGYVAFAADIYGKGIRPQTNEDAGKQAGIYKSDRSLMRKRARAALNVLKNYPFTDAEKLAAIGYCFGGTVVLELARSGAELKGTVSFHGGLDTPHPADAKNIQGRLLVLHGADDPYVAKTDVEAFKKEISAANVPLRFVSYDGAVHGFTNPANGSDVSQGVAYNKAADERSWEEMKKFFDEIFK